jgi:hypothetical protein
MIEGRSSPLRVWIIVFFAVGIGLTGAVWYARTTSRPQEIAKARMKRLDSMKLNPKKLNIIILGDSLTVRAFPSKEEAVRDALQQNLAMKGCMKTDVEVFNLAYGGCDVSILKQYLDRIIQTRPQVLLIQADFLAPWKERRGFKKILGDLGIVAHLVRLVVTDAIRSFSLSIREPVQNYLPAILRPTDSKAVSGVDASRKKEKQPRFGAYLSFEGKLEYIQEGVTDTPSTLDLGREFVEKATKSGIQIIIIETPRSFALTSRLTRDVFGERRALIEHLLRQYPIEYYQFPRTLPDSYFIDSRHVNQSGTKLFFPWFCQTFAREHIEF